MIKKIFISIVLINLLMGCKKNRPPVGLYSGFFNYEYPSTWSDNNVWLKIVETNKSYFLIGVTDFDGNMVSQFFDTIFKSDKNKINGRLGSYILTGEWEKEFLRKKYTLKGTFTQNESTQGGEFTYYGTFEIKTK